MSPAVEIAVADLAGLRIAARHGADRVELCTDLDRGGVTAPADLIAACAEEAARLVAAREAKPGFGVHALIRSRAGAGDFREVPGEFVCDGEDVATMALQAEAAVHAGAHGVVLGALTPEGRVDRAAVETIRDAALTAATASLRGLTLTFHRALDAMPSDADRIAAIDELLGLGFHRALSSGGAACAADGAECLAAMVEAADDLLEVCAGGGIRPAHIPALVSATGVAGIHLSARRRSPLRPGEDDPGTDTDPAVVQAAVDAAGEQ